LDLAACRQLALQQQPAIAAARASLTAAVVRQQSLENLRVPTCLARDLPTRRQQASLGITIAQATVQQAEQNTLYGVNFSYVSYLYAREQLQMADTALENLRHLRKVVDQGVKDGSRGDWSARDVKKLDIYILVAQGRREEASLGAERAASALREALGMGPYHAFALAHDRLLDAKVVPDRQKVLALAVSQRPEMVQVVNGAQVTGLEVCAQQKKHFSIVAPTFASGGDLHAQPLPAGSYDTEYKPAAVGPEMPVTFTGSRADRVEQARVYAGRAESMVEKTHNLLTLEADQAYLRWDESTKKLAKYEDGARQARALFSELRGQFQPTNTKLSLETLLTAAVLSAQLTSYTHEARYRQLTALAELERVTGGAFSACLDTAPVVPEETNGNGKGNGKR
jgi:outer membrane protein TolC